MQPEELFASVFVLVVLSGVFIVVMGLRQRSQQLEMQHRERMAMIERGIVPTGSELGEVRGHRGFARTAGGASASRSLSLGIVVVALGLGLMTLISVAAEAPEIGVGVGGAIAILGSAFIVRALVVRTEIGVPPAPPAAPPSDIQLS